MDDSSEERDGGGGVGFYEGWKNKRGEEGEDGTKEEEGGEEGSDELNVSFSFASTLCYQSLLRVKTSRTKENGATHLLLPP